MVLRRHVDMNWLGIITSRVSNAIPPAASPRKPGAQGGPETDFDDYEDDDDDDDSGEVLVAVAVAVAGYPAAVESGHAVERKVEQSVLEKVRLVSLY